MTEIEKLMERLREFVEVFAFCPCCEQVRQCVDGCTFAQDSPEGFNNMGNARYALYGDDDERMAR